MKMIRSRSMRENMLKLRSPLFDCSMTIGTSAERGSVIMSCMIVFRIVALARAYIGCLDDAFKWLCFPYERSEARPRRLAAEIARAPRGRDRQGDALPAAPA